MTFKFASILSIMFGWNGEDECKFTDFGERVTTCHVVLALELGGSIFYLGQTAATKPDKVNILLCDINERLIVMWL